MRVIVTFFANVRMKVGRDDLVLDLPGREQASVFEVLRAVSEATGAVPETFMTRTEDGGERAVVRAVLNGKDTQFSGGLSARLADGDTLALFPLLGGG